MTSRRVLAGGAVARCSGRGGVSWLAVVVVVPRRGLLHAHECERRRCPAGERRRRHSTSGRGQFAPGRACPLRRGSSLADVHRQGDWCELLHRNRLCVAAVRCEHDRRFQTCASRILSNRPLSGAVRTTTSDDWYTHSPTPVDAPTPIGVKPGQCTSAGDGAVNREARGTGVVGSVDGAKSDTSMGNDADSMLSVSAASTTSSVATSLTLGCSGGGMADARVEAARACVIPCRAP
jgi:hypothetical protein